MNRFFTSLLALLLVGFASAWADLPFEVTTLTDEGEFADDTNWYSMTIGAASLVLTDNESADYIYLDVTELSLDEALQWCFVGNDDDGYLIFNRQAGPGKVLTAPVNTSDGNTGGSTYAILMDIDLDDDDYINRWDFAEATSTSNSAELTVENGWYVNEHGYSSAILNNRDLKLAFWTSGYDNGSAIVISPLVLHYYVSADTGDLTSSVSGSSYAYLWTSTAEDPQLTLTAGANNMCAGTDNWLDLHSGTAASSAYTLYAGEDYIISGFSASVRNESSNSNTTTVTVGDDTFTVDDDSQTIEVSGLESMSASFTVDGHNHAVLFEDFLVEISASFSEGSGQTNLFITSSSSVPPYRIPAIAKASNGDLIAVTDYRPCYNDIGYGQVDLHYRISQDNGETWGDEIVLVEGSGTSGAVDCGFGDAAIVADSESSEVLLICVCGNVVYTSSTRTNNNRQARFRSHDYGQTWSEYEEITEDLYGLFDDSANGELYGLFFGSGRICQSQIVKVGDYYRLYAALAARPNGNRVLFSDDFGETWNALGGIDALPVPSGDEPKTEELPDGSVIVSSRCTGGRYFNIFTYSDVESGSGTWGDVAFSGSSNSGTTAVSNACNGEILIIPVVRNSDGEEVYLALQSVPFGSGRYNVGIYYKELSDPDEDFADPDTFAANWDGSYQVSSMSSAYSTMIMQDDNRLAFYYEEGTYGYSYTEVYKALEIETITDSAYTYNPGQDRATFVVNHQLAPIYEDYIEVETGSAVGMLSTESYEAISAAVEEIVADYVADPDPVAYQNAVAELTAVLEDAETVEIVNEGEYTLQNKAYPDYYLSISDVAGNLHSDKYTYEGATEVGEGQKFVFNAMDDGSFYITNVSAGTYVGRCLAAAKYVEQQDADNIGYYTVVSTPAGWSYLKCTKPASAAKPALGLTEDNHVQPLAVDNEAALWRIVATGEVLTGISEATTVAEASVEHIYYDLSGRMVKKPSAGIYIVNGKKVILK